MSQSQKSFPIALLLFLSLLSPIYGEAAHAEGAGALTPWAEENFLRTPQEMGFETLEKIERLEKEEREDLALQEEERETVRIYARRGFLPPELLYRFEEGSGYDTSHAFYDTTDQIEEALSQEESAYDVIIMPASFLDHLLPRHALSVLDKEALPHYDRLMPLFLEKLRQLNPHNDHAIPYLWGSSGLIYDEEKITQRIELGALSSWAVLFEPEQTALLADCGLAVPDRPLEVLTALRAFRENREGPPKETPPAATDSAEGSEEDRDQTEDRLAMLSREAEHLWAALPFLEHVAPPRSILHGAFCLAMGSQAEIFEIIQEAAQQDPPLALGFSRPREGAFLWMDVMTAPADLVAYEGAHAFMDFMLQEDAAATLASLTGFASPHEGARALMDEDMRASETLNPDPALLEGLRIERGWTKAQLEPLTRQWESLVGGKRSPRFAPPPLLEAEAEDEEEEEEETEAIPLASPSPSPRATPQ